MKRKGLFGLALLTSFCAFSQIPAGYYDSAAGLTGEDLREELHQIINDHTAISYESIKTTYHSLTDKKSNSKVWDMYSDVPGGTLPYEYSFVASDQCGNYTAEGDCYNREHSFPQAWFNSNDPMQTDLFHVYPTDGYVNGKRSNFPYGIVGTASWTSANGSKLGSSGTTGYTGTVFEPIDEYKGDFARTYFYMVTRYKDIAAGWTSEMLNGNDLTDWAKNLLVLWDENDPVSQKEIDRNNAVYNIQQNRNPYIDKPEYVDVIWGDAASIDNFAYSNHFVINYSNQTLNISLDRKMNSTITVYSVIGNQVLSTPLVNANSNFDLPLETGIYLAVIDGVSQKFVVY